MSYTTAQFAKDISQAYSKLADEYAEKSKRCYEAEMKLVELMADNARGAACIAHLEARLHTATEALDDIADILNLPTGCSLKDIVIAVRGGAE